MDNFQDFIKSYAPQHFAIAAPLNLLINAVIMWYVVNQLSNIGEKVALWRAGLCAALLYGVSALSVWMLMFPQPVLLIFAALIWFGLSLVVIRSIFELTHQSGLGIFIKYLLLLVTVHLVVNHVMG